MLWAVNMSPDPHDDVEQLAKHWMCGMESRAITKHANIELKSPLHCKQGTQYNTNQLDRICSTLLASLTALLQVIVMSDVQIRTEAHMLCRLVLRSQ